jgi:hypothetical protein
MVVHRPLKVVAFKHKLLQGTALTKVPVHIGI